jgi:UDP-GlcNAc:undecaprenyl-phosphate/decaprenyl-phosphate GlcNAc-1-phosphate transferase
MSRLFALALIAAVGFLYARADATGRLRAGRGLAVPNYRGRRVPIVLGVSLAVALMAPGLAVLVVFALGGHGGLGHAGRLLLLLVGGAIVFLAGVYDDLHPGQTRGVLGHLRQLLRGTLTAGGVKLLAGLAGAALAAVSVGPGGWAMAFGIPAAAGATNTLNLLDVAPGRALKAFLVAGAVLTALSWRSDAAIVEVACLGAAVALLPFDLRERAMLGDAGANLLGYVVGVGLLAGLSPLGLAVALVAVLAVHVAAETVTLSRVIRATPPLRWLDDLGRAHVRVDEPAPRRSHIPD